MGKWSKYKKKSIITKFNVSKQMMNDWKKSKSLESSLRL
jgi:hypothetical protein